MSLESTIAELNANIVELIKLIRSQNEIAVQSWSPLVPPTPAEVKEATAAATHEVKANTPPPPPKPVEATPAPTVTAPLTHDSVRNLVRGYIEKDQGNSSKFKAFLAEAGIASVTACPAERLNEIIAFIGGKP